MSTCTGVRYWNTGKSRAVTWRILVRQILLHEIGHHFGFSDAEMDHICAQARREAKGTTAD